VFRVSQGYSETSGLSRGIYSSFVSDHLIIRDFVCQQFDLLKIVSREERKFRYGSPARIGAKVESTSFYSNVISSVFIEDAV